MATPHVIRLSRAWEHRAAAPDGLAGWDDAQAAGGAEDAPVDRIDLPWPDAAAEAPPGKQWLLRRRFNGPTNLQPQQRVLLVIHPAELADRVWLNDTPLTDRRGEEEENCAWFDVASLLKRHNYLHILAAPPALAAAQVRLVIQETDS